MEFFEILVIAVGLAMDAFAVSISNSMATREVLPKYAFKIGGFCGVFQLVMPIIGWLLGRTVSGYISAVDHWIAFGLLGFLGVRMIIESFKNGKNGSHAALNDAQKYSFKRLLVIAIATSIDALAVGVTMALLEVDIIAASLIIGVVAFVFALTGTLAGKRLGKLLRNKAEIVGGALLIIIGLRILFEHLLSVNS